MQISADQNFIKTLDEAIINWLDDGIKLNAGVSAETIKHFENEINFIFEDDFAQYLNKVNGFIDYSSGESWFSFWSLSRIKFECESKSHPEKFIWFADHSLNLCSFGFSKNDGKIYTHFDNSSDIMFITHSFHQFVRLYLEDPYQLIL